MNAHLTRDPWRTAWHIATSDSLLAAVLLCTMLGLLIPTWLPQMPSSDPIAYAQWLSEARAHYGDIFTTMRALGLFTLARSFTFRALLALLAACLLLRTIEHVDALRRPSDVPDADPSLAQAGRWPWAESLAVAAHIGGLLLLSGILLNAVWGWQEKGLILRGGERVELHGDTHWVALDDGARRAAHSPSLTTAIEAHIPGVQVSATDTAGQIVALQRAEEIELVEQVAVPLADDQYIAAPDAQLILRLAPQVSQNGSPDSYVRGQVYRSPPGRLVDEIILTGDDTLEVDGVTFSLASTPYALLAVSYTPGLWPISAGVLLAAAGLLGQAIWPIRHGRLREGSDSSEGAGGLPGSPSGGKET